MRLRRHWRGVVARVPVGAAVVERVVRSPVWNGSLASLIAGGVDLAVLATLIVSVAMSGRLRASNAQFERRLADTARVVRSLRATFIRTMQVNASVGSGLPAPLRRPIETALARTRRPVDGAVLLMVYTPSVCERTLSEGRTSLRSSRIWREHAATIYAVVGERSRADRERALLMEQAMPVSTAPIFLSADIISRTLFVATDTTFGDEPVYVWLNSDLSVHSAFHADQWNPGLLDAWLETIP